MPDTRRIRGDINVILNRLVGEGVIAGFTTSFDDKSAGRVAISVVAGSATNPKVVRLAVRTELKRFLDQVTVVVKPG
jgi:hypothetical protein